MVAAARLAGAGRSVVLLDAAADIGGFIGSAERTVPGYVHDTWSSWHPLFVTGPAYAELGADLHRHGLEYANTDRGERSDGGGRGPLTATVSDDGTATIAHRDVEETVKRFGSAADADAYRAMVADFTRDTGALGTLLGSELWSPSVLRPLASLVRTAGRRGARDYARDVVTSGRSWLRTRFEGPETDRLWAPWLLHAASRRTRRAAGRWCRSSRRRCTAPGSGRRRGRGVLRRRVAGPARGAGRRRPARTPVDRIVVRGGRAVGVEGDGPGGRFAVRASVVLASVAPGALYGELLPAGSVPAAVAAQAAASAPDERR